MAHISNKYKLGDIVIYNGNHYRVTTVHRIATNCYKYDLFLVREPREGELSIIKGVNEYAISHKVDYHGGFTFTGGRKHDLGDTKNKRIFSQMSPFDMMYPVKSSLKALGELNRREVERIAASPIRIDIDDAIKANYTKEEIKKMINNTFNNTFGVPKFEYKKIIFNGPCTIILWKDGTKTIAKTSDGEMFDPEKGVAICFMKRALGETEGKKVLRKANKDFYDEVARAASKELDEVLKKATFPLPKGVTFRPFNFDGSMDNNKVIKVEKVEENHKMDFRSCSTCKYASKPVIDKPCSNCASKSHYEKGYEK